MSSERPGTTWRDLGPWQRRAIVVAGVAGTVMQALMLWDLRRRPAEAVRGPKTAWVAASFARPFGQLAYLRWGRRAPRTDASQPPEVGPRG